jgi:serine/threonine protein kinase
MQSEIELLSSFHHKNIVKYLGTNKDQYKFSIFLEYVPGGSLERIYKTYPMNETLI